ncbi:MAG: M16 family metallopeptidase, partial [Planctomycetota bacterium]
MLDEYKRVELDNGLCVIGVENPALHYFSCHARVHAGPRFEPREHVGLTHMLEHMIIQGSENYPSSRDIMRSIEDLGGVLDASTHPESLDVYVGLHRKHWQKGLDIFTDVILNPLFDREEIEQEKNILVQEISNHRDERDRNISAAEMAYSLLFLEELDERGSRGSVENIHSFNQTMVRDYYDQFFIPQNMVISLAGSYDFDEIVGQLNETVGQKKGDNCPPKVLSADVQTKRARSVYRQ